MAAPGTPLTRARKRALMKETGKPETDLLEPEAFELDALAAGEARPRRPAGLRRELLRLYALLVVLNLGFVLLSLTMQHPVQEGTFELADGQTIKLEDFNPLELGPFPKCHDNHGEHMVTNAEGKAAWVANADVGPKVPEGADAEAVAALEAAFDYPPGHPKNKEWVLKREARAAESKLSFSALQPSIHLLLLSVTVVYLACKHAVWMYTIPDPVRDSEDVEREEDVAQSALQDGDAYMFPIMGSCVLFSLFVVYKYLDSELVKYLFSCYVTLMCVNGLGMNLGQALSLWHNSRGLGRYTTLFRVPYFNVDVTKVDVAAYAVASVLGVVFMTTKHWVANNVLGVSFCVLGIKLIGISSYRTGIIMLCGLFMYDVFWVFYSKQLFGHNVMVTVAMGVQAPIKLMFPRSQDGCGEMQFSMLGLGDIVVPGLVIAFIAKYDVFRSKFKGQYVFLDWTMLAYTLSLITTVVIMLVFNHAQPALLYIVPYVIAASALTALATGELGALWKFEVLDTEEEAKAKAEATKEHAN